MLLCGPVAAQQKNVKARERQHAPCCWQRNNGAQQGTGYLRNGRESTHPLLARNIRNDADCNRGGQNVSAAHARENHVCNKKAFVSAADAISNKRAVVIEFIDTSLTCAAMGRTGWFWYLTRGADWTRLVAVGIYVGIRTEYWKHSVVLSDSRYCIVVLKAGCGEQDTGRN
jgi:hypothetical protein